MAMKNCDRCNMLTPNATTQYRRQSRESVIPPEPTRVLWFCNHHSRQYGPRLIELGFTERVMEETRV